MPDYTSVVWLRKSPAVARAEAAMVARIQALADSGRYPHLAGFDLPNQRGLYPTSAASTACCTSRVTWSSPPPAASARPARTPASSASTSADPAAIAACIRSPTVTTRTTNRDDTYAFPDADLRAYTSVRAAPEASGVELVCSVRAIIAEESQRLAAERAEIERT